ncbi:hypothetical protein BDZ45DRAFT_126304 [Acephala macrosclerotiorum]|nr:hypothetical protein BDZ45DRAFT_126304 [Acephala macrosclerotiorum]
MNAPDQPERGGWDEDKCRNFIVRTLEWVPRNYNYQDGLRFIHKELEIAFGDENGHLAIGVLEELILLDGLPPWPEAIFQRWKHAYRHRHEVLHTPHTPSTRTILRPVIATKKVRLSLPLANDGIDDTDAASPVPLPPSSSVTTEGAAVEIVRMNTVLIEEPPASIVPEPVTPAAEEQTIQSDLEGTARSETSWAIEHTVYMSKKGAKPSIFSAFTREEFEQKSRDPRFGTGGKITGMKFVHPPSKDEHISDATKALAEESSKGNFDSNKSEKAKTQEGTPDEHVHFARALWVVLRRRLQKLARSVATGIRKHEDEEASELESELNFKKFSKKMFQAEKAKRFDFQRHLREMHWPSEVEIPNANFARKYHLVPRGEVLPVEILNVRQHTVTEDVEGAFKWFWAHARFEIEDLQIEGESLSGTLRQKLFFRYVEDCKDPLPLDPSLFLDTGLDFNWGRSRDGSSVESLDQISNETLSGCRQDKSTAEDLGISIRGPESTEYLAVDLAISLHSGGHNSSVGSVDDWHSAQSHPVTEGSQNGIIEAQKKEDVEESTHPFMLPRTTYIPSSPTTKTSKETKMAKTITKYKRSSSRGGMVLPYSPTVSSRSASFSERRGGVLTQPNTTNVPEIKCHSPGSSTRPAMSGLTLVSNQKQFAQSDIRGSSASLRSPSIKAIPRDRGPSILTGNLTTSTSMRTGRFASKLNSTECVTQRFPNISNRPPVPSLAFDHKKILKGSTRKTSIPPFSASMGCMGSRPIAGSLVPREVDDFDGSPPPGPASQAPRNVVVAISSGDVPDGGSRPTASDVHPLGFDEMCDATPPTSPRRAPRDTAAGTSSVVVQSSHPGPMDNIVSPPDGLDDTSPPESHALAIQRMVAATNNELVRSGSVKSMARPLSPKEFDDTYHIPHVGLPHIVPPGNGSIEEQSPMSLVVPVSKNSNDIFSAPEFRQRDSANTRAAPSQHLQTSQRVTSIGAETRQRDSPELSRVYRWQNRHQHNTGNFDGASGEICLPTLGQKDNPNVHKTTVHVNGYEITTVCWNVSKNNPKMASEQGDLASYYDSPSPPPLRIFKQPGHVRVAQSQQQLGEDNPYKENLTFPPRISSMRTSELVDDGFGLPIAETFNYVDRDRGHNRKRSNATSSAATAQSSRAINSVTNPSAGYPARVNTSGSALSNYSSQHLSGSSGIIGNFVPFDSPAMNISAPAANNNRGNLDTLGKIKKDVNPYQFEPDTPVPAHHHTHMTTFTDFISDPHESQLAHTPEAFFLKKSPSTGNSMSNGHQFTPMKPAGSKSDKRGMPRSESSPAVSHPARFQAQFQRGPDIASRYGEVVDPSSPTRRGRSPQPQGRRGRSYEEDGTPKAFNQYHAVDPKDWRFPEPPRRPNASHQHNQGHFGEYHPETPLRSPLRAPTIEQNAFSSSVSSRYRPASPTKPLGNVVERDEVVADLPETPSSSPKKRSRSPMKKMFGENGWLGHSPLEAQGTARQVQKASANPKEKKGLMDKLRAKMVDIAEKADLSPIGRSRNSADNPAKISFLPTSLAPPYQARILAEVEFFLVHTANSFLMNQFSQGRLDVDSIKKTIDAWKAKGRPNVIEFMYDQATQRDLIAINQQNLQFYGRRADDIVRINTTLHTWKLVARYMAIRTFCEADTVILKLFFDIEQILELLGCVDSLLARFQQVRTITNDRIRQQKKHNSEAQSVRNGQERTWYTQSSESAGAAARSMRESFDDPYGGLKLVPDHYRAQYG